LESYTDRQLALIAYNTVEGGPLGAGNKSTPWWTVAREEQLPPECLWKDKLIWLVLAGRGWGKTRTGSEWVRSIQAELPQSRGAIIAKDPGEARDVMIEGVSGIMACSSKFDRPVWNPSLKRLTWPNGTQAGIFSSEDYDELRGPQHHWAWCDELPKWRNAEQTWEQIQFGLRLGNRPRVCITSTPRPIKVLRQILKDPLTHVTKGSTYDNISNLSPMYRSIIARYEGTRLGRQELAAEVLDDVPGALWTYSMIDASRISEAPLNSDLARVVVGVDPTVGDGGEEGDECGIIVAARDSEGHGYVLADRTIRGRPEVWAKRAVDAYHEFEADRIVPEGNNGGKMIESTLRQYDSTVPVKIVQASRGKITRAEPISLLYERGLISHVGSWPELEDQMCTYSAEDIRGKQNSPDRMDALVWAFTELFDVGIVDMDDAVVGGMLTTERDFPDAGIARSNVREDFPF
jgi:phage terminase large subunit-like protein